MKQVALHCRRWAALVGSTLACGALFGAGCSSGDEQRGQLIVAITSDMPVPKDISSIEIEVHSSRTTTFDTLSFDHELTGDTLALPATLNLVTGRDPTQPVKVLSKAWQGTGPERKLRVYAERVTTQPTEGADALLEIPMEWLCSDFAEQKSGADCPGGESVCIDTGCPEDDVCIGGVCESNFVDPDTLPPYDESWDDAHASGECFDALGCFEGSSIVGFVNQQACTVDFPTAEAEGINVAMVLPSGGDGNCQGDKCYIVLDFGTETGWTQTGNQVALPSRVCTLLREGALEGIAISTSCRSKTPSWRLCGQ